MRNKTIHILRYGTVAEKMHLGKAISAYDYLSINGNTAAYVSGAISKFIVEKFFSKPEKGFFIDPITYAFQNEIQLLYTKSKTIGDEVIKKSISKLIEIYGFPATKVFEKVPIITTDFADNAILFSFCERILTFQYDLVYKHIDNNDLRKYLDYVVEAKTKDIPQLRPKFLIAPYFYLDSQKPAWEAWLDINIKFLNQAHLLSQEKYLHTDVFGQIVVDKGILTNEQSIEKIICAYKDVNCDGFTVWIDDLNEHEATLEEITGYIKLLSGLKAMKKPIYNMYGGYFSILLTHKEIALLSGVSHGLEYGESRKVYPVGGGIPVSKYYFMPLHQRMDFTKAFYLLEQSDIIDTSKNNWGSSERYFQYICKCEQCKRIIGTDMINFIEFESKEFYEIHRKDHVLRRKKASSDTKQNCLYHYLLCKKIEFAMVNKRPLYELLDDLVNNGRRYSKCEFIKKGELSYTEVWNSAIRR